MFYDYSRQARLLTYVDVLNQPQIYNYDKSSGQLQSTTLGTTSARFYYNAQGEIDRIETTDGTQTLTTKLTYDDHGREMVREFDFGGGVIQQLNQIYNVVDGMVQSTLTEAGTILRDQTYKYDVRSRLEEYECKGKQPPLDPYGNEIEMQLFFFDEVDNIVRADTYFPGDRNRANYTYDNPNDPAQLTAVTNNHPDYPSVINLTYNADGNLLCDEEGRSLGYDDLGRLISVSEPTGGAATKTYGYDSLDALASQNAGGGDQLRFYQDDKIHTLHQGAERSTFVQANGVVLAERQAGVGPKS
ncbi:hypothetical protein IMF27_04295 [Pseudomonas sp. PCH199]|uniref:hypothetical protein n=1 Tax=unclassified Pseudomonas TaxID=196821 RepID=UPI000BD785B8|nr:MULTISPECIES: hypothetical protein [unclassified Pseudomonas]MCW8275017.1 hypothetical protein [Pseudomonas sp. PCH199]PAM84693.1 hypothetical protein CES87_04380 [Pseudomonas sp. ERMR1:02]